MDTLLIILYSLLSLLLLLGVIFLAVAIYVLVQVRKHVKNVADKAGEAIQHIHDSHGILGKILGIPLVAYLAQKLVRRFL